jgi:WD40 repeat protein
LKIICELGFSSAVEKIEIGGRYLVVGSGNEIYVYDLASMKLEITINEPGKQLKLMAGASSGNMIAYLDQTSPSKVKIYSVTSKSVVTEIHAHKSGVKVAKLSSDGTLLATASEKVRKFLNFKTVGHLD